MLEKANKAITEEYSPTYISGFIDTDINERKDTTSQDDLCPISRRINFEIRVPTRGNISSTRRREPSSYNREYNVEVTDTLNPTSERL